MQVEQNPEHLRTLTALQRTMVYLRTIMDVPGASLVDIHRFLWDRYRGVRQDLSVQGMQVRSSSPLHVILLHCCLVGHPQERCADEVNWMC